MSDYIKIGNIKARKGERVFGYLKVDDAHATTTSLPVGILKGENPGPTLCFTGCTGGSTYPGVEACIRLWKETDPNSLNGTIISVPVVNVPLFRAKVPRENPIDHKNIAQNCFPGRLDGTLSEAIAYVLFNEIILKSDYHIDMRGGDLDEIETESMTYMLIGDDKIDDELNSIAKISGQKWLQRGEYSKKQKNSLMANALKNGVISFIAMIATGMGQYSEEDVMKDIEFARRVMKYLKMIPGKVEPYPGKQYIFTGSGAVNVKKGGLWHPLITRMAPIKIGQVTGYVKDLKGDIIEEVVSPIDGICHVLLPARVVFRGDAVYSFRTIEEAWIK
jgi:predicted deacylase